MRKKERKKEPGKQVKCVNKRKKERKKEGVKEEESTIKN